jgi:hypothetical protein
MTVTTTEGRIPTDVDEESAVDVHAGGDAEAKFEQLVQRLNVQSVRKHFDAYEDIPWDDPDYAIDPADPRWEFTPSVNSLGASDWYRSLPQETRAEIGLFHIASSMKIGLQFESVLKRGLLEFAFNLPNGDPKFRYAYHEMIEEGQHALMFQEFVNRTGYDIPGLPRYIQVITRQIVALGRRFPELFFMFVLGGEDPIDHVQREALREGTQPPVLERIMRIHVTEEARHLSFARHYLKLRAAEMGPLRRTVLGIGAPIILGVMAQLMMQPSPALIRRFDVPKSVVDEVYRNNPDHAARTRTALRKVRRLSQEIGIVNPLTKPIWKALGIWED